MTRIKNTHQKRKCLTLHLVRGDRHIFWIDKYYFLLISKKPAVQYFILIMKLNKIKNFISFTEKGSIDIKKLYFYLSQFWSLKYFLLIEITTWVFQ